MRVNGVIRVIAVIEVISRVIKGVSCKFLVLDILGALFSDNVPRLKERGKLQQATHYLQYAELSA